MAASYPIIPGVTFKSIERFPGYCFGDDGSAWGCRPFTRFTGQMLDTWRRLSPQPNPKGYLTVLISDGSGRSRRYRLAKLILEAFVGPCPPGMEACHFPERDRSNNRLDNLRWDTKKGNFKDRDTHGTTAIGERCGSSKLTAPKVIEMRRLASLGASRSKLASRFGVAKTTVEDVVKRITWKHLE